MKKHLLMLALASTCFVATQAGAQMNKDEHKVAKEKMRPTTRSPRPSATR